MLVQAASSGGLARRNVNTDRPISLIGPIRSNARHSPTLYTVAVRHGGVPESRHCSYREYMRAYVQPHVCADIHAGRFEKGIASLSDIASRSITRVHGQIDGVVTRLRYVTRDGLYLGRL